MSQDGFSISATLKGGVGYDAPWLVIYGNHPDEVADKLEAVANGNLVNAVITASNALKAGNRAAPVAQGGPDAYPQEQPEQQAPPQQQNSWGNSNGGNNGGGGQRQDSGWNRPAPRQVDNAPAQQHPGGLTCHCGQAAEFKTTSSGKKVWRCPAWRWQSGNPNDHLQEWVN